jgi:isopentenyl diphosphate isomerase/L-lactate dehydrogenase-like FMN-dependent dehydrogenase
VSALGRRGGDHVAQILLADLQNNMIQLGCKTIGELRAREIVM